MARFPHRPVDLLYMQRFHTSSEIVCMNGADAKYAWILGLYRNLTKLIYKITKIVCVL